MSRRNAAVKREVLPDPLYNSTLVTKIVNQVMLDGKKGIAQSIVYTAMKNSAEKLNDEAMNVLTKFNLTEANPIKFEYRRYVDTIAKKIKEKQLQYNTKPLTVKMVEEIIEEIRQDKKNIGIHYDDKEEKDNNGITSCHTVINEVLIKEIENVVGFDKKYLTQCINDNEINYATATYYLLLKDIEGGYNSSTIKSINNN